MFKGFAKCHGLLLSSTVVLLIANSLIEIRANTRFLRLNAHSNFRRQEMLTCIIEVGRTFCIVHFFRIYFFIFSFKMLHVFFSVEIFSFDHLKSIFIKWSPAAVF